MDKTLDRFETFRKNLDIEFVPRLVYNCFKDALFPNKPVYSTVIISMKMIKKEYRSLLKAPALDVIEEEDPDEDSEEEEYFKYSRRQHIENMLRTGAIKDNSPQTFYDWVFYQKMIYKEDKFELCGTNYLIPLYHNLRNQIQALFELYSSWYKVIITIHLRLTDNPDTLELICLEEYTSDACVAVDHPILKPDRKHEKSVEYIFSY